MVCFITISDNQTVNGIENISKGILFNHKFISIQITASFIPYFGVV